MGDSNICAQMEPEKPKLRKKRRSKKSIKQPSTEISIDGNLTDLIDEFSKPTFIEPDTQDIMSGETMELLVEAIKTANHEPLIVQPTNESVNSTVEQMKKDLAEVTELTDGTAWSDVEDVPRDRDEHRTKSRRNTKDSSKRRTRKSLKMCQSKIDDVDLKVEDHLLLTKEDKAQNGEKEKYQSPARVKSKHHNGTADERDQLDAVDKPLSSDNSAPVVAGVKVIIHDEDLMFFGNTKQRRRTLKGKQTTATKPWRDQNDDGKSTDGLIAWFKNNVCKCIAK